MNRKYIRNLSKQEVPTFSKEEMRDLCYKNRTIDSRFKLRRDYSTPEILSHSTAYFDDIKTGKIYAVSIDIYWYTEEVTYGIPYEVEKLEETYVAYKNKSNDGSGMYLGLDFKKRRNY